MITREETFIIAVVVDAKTQRGDLEMLENTVFEVEGTPDANGNLQTFTGEKMEEVIRKRFAKFYSDYVDADELEIMRMTDFMDVCNDDAFNIQNHFIGYVRVINISTVGLA